jgi:hypothetical protein
MHDYSPLRKKTNTSYTVRFTSCQDKHSICIINTNQCMLYCEIIAVCPETHAKCINAVCGQNMNYMNVKPAVNKIAIGL